MALAYAFFDEAGIRYGEPGPDRPEREFPCVPVSGPFAGQLLTVHAASLEGDVSGTWVRSTDRYGCFATTTVAELLKLVQGNRGPRAD